MQQSRRFSTSNFSLGASVKPQTDKIIYQLKNDSINSSSSPRSDIGQSNLRPSSVYHKKLVDEDQQHVVRLASQISNNDLNFLATMETENGTWDMYRKHDGLQQCYDKKNKKNYYRHGNCDGTMDYSCGLNSAYHKDMISKIVKKTVSEEEILRYCYSVYQNRPTAFYGYKVRMKNINKFELI